MSPPRSLDGDRILLLSCWKLQVNSNRILTPRSHVNIRVRTLPTAHSAAISGIALIGV